MKAEGGSRRAVARAQGEGWVRAQARRRECPAKGCERARRRKRTSVRDGPGGPCGRLGR